MQQLLFAFLLPAVGLFFMAFSSSSPRLIQSLFFSLFVVVVVELIRTGYLIFPHIWPLSYGMNTNTCSSKSGLSSTNIQQKPSAAGNTFFFQPGIISYLIALIYICSLRKQFLQIPCILKCLLWPQNTSVYMSLSLQLLLDVQII